MKKQIIKTEKELTRFLNTYGVTKKLNTIKNLTLDDGKNVKLTVKKDGATFTNMKDITIGVPYEKCINLDTGKIITLLEGLTIHECYHILRTNSKVWDLFIENCGEKFHKDFNIPLGFGKYIAKDILNGVEDGRIERIASEDLAYQADCLSLTNAILRSTTKINEKGKPEQELFDTIFCFCMYAVLGYPTIGYSKIYESNMKYLNKAKKYIFDFVRTDSMEDAIVFLYSAIDECYPLFKRLFDSIDFDKYMNKPQDNIGSGCGSNDTPSSGIPMASSQSQSSDKSNNDDKQSNNSNGKSSNTQKSNNDKSEDKSKNGGTGNSAKNNEEDNNSKADSKSNSGDKSENKGKGLSDNKSDEKSDGDKDSNSKGNCSKDDSESKDNSEDINNSNKSDSDSNNDSDKSDEGDKSAEGNESESGNAESLSDRINGKMGLIKNEGEINESNLENCLEEILNDLINSLSESLSEDMERTLNEIESENRYQEQQEKEELNEAENEDVLDILDTMGMSYRDWRRFNLNYRYFDSSTNYQATNDIISEANYIKPKIEKIFKNKKSQVRKNINRGYINSNSLWKLGIHDDKIFQRKKLPKDTDYVVYILMDRSGSMRSGLNSKFNKALKATSLLEECLVGLVPLKIVSFNCVGNNTINHDIIKNFSDNKNCNYSERYYQHNNSGGCNVDGFSIRVATAELMKRPERHKLLIVLSDGQPNGPLGYDGKQALNDVKDSVYSARNKGIKVFNIMFANSDMERLKMAPTFNYMYEKGIISCPPQYIGEELVSLIQKELR